CVIIIVVQMPHHFYYPDKKIWAKVDVEVSWYVQNTLYIKNDRSACHDTGCIKRIFSEWH
ncbi:hypothetical protein, partial [Salmonella enterica]